MNRTSTSSVTPHRAYGSIPQPNLLWPRVLPFYSSVSGPWEHGGRYLLLTDRKHLSFVPPDRTRQKNHNRKSSSCRESSVGDIFIWGGGFVVRLLINDVRIGLSSSESEKKRETERNHFVSVTYLIRLNRIWRAVTIIHINFSELLKLSVWLIRQVPRAFGRLLSFPN